MSKSRSVLKKSQRPQSALELITTYSWAFLILALVIAVVFILIGTRPASGYLASQCSIQPLLPCTQSIITTYNSIVPIKYTVLFINNVAPALFFPVNSFVVTTSGIGKSGTNSFKGNCTPQFALEGDEVVCAAAISGTLISSVGSSVTTDFNTTYEICSTANQINCPTSLYTSSGFSQQDVQPASSIFYKLKLASSPNSIIVIDDQRYTTGQYVLLQSGNYVVYSVAPSGYMFASWSATPGASVLSSNSINTTATISYNGILTVNFVMGGTTTTTVSGSACTCGGTYVSCGGIQECTGCPGSCPATSSLCPFGQHSYICMTTSTSTSSTSTSSTSSSSTTSPTTTSTTTSTSTSTTTINPCLQYDFSSNTILTSDIVTTCNVIVESGVTLTTDEYSIITSGSLTINGLITTSIDQISGGAGSEWNAAPGESAPNSYGGSGGAGGGGIVFTVADPSGTETYGGTWGGNGGNTLVLGGTATNGYSGCGLPYDSSPPCPPFNGATPNTPTLNNPTIQTWYGSGNGAIQPYLEGAAGGGGGGASTGSSGTSYGSGANGAAGGYGLYIQAYSITFNNAGSITTTGGTGSNANDPSNNCIAGDYSGSLCSDGGGGGGGGGTVILAVETNVMNENVITSGGAGGLYASIGVAFPYSDGSPGGAGATIIYQYTTPPITP